MHAFLGVSTIGLFLSKDVEVYNVNCKMKILFYIFLKGTAAKWCSENMLLLIIKYACE